MTRRESQPPLAPAYESERALCESFATTARADGWTVYPEQGTWDMLLVRGRVQVGIQAKLGACVEVLLQALPRDLEHTSSRHRTRVRAGRSRGPQYRAVLVGGFRGRTLRAQQEQAHWFYALARHLRLLVLEPPPAPPHIDSGCWCRRDSRHGNLETFHPWGRRWSHLDCRNYRWKPEKPEWVPPFVPDLPAGVPSPQTVSPWMIAAVKLEQLARERGWVALADAQSVTTEVGGRWNQSTLLDRACDCTGEPVGDGVRGSRWKLKRYRPPSNNYPAVAKAMGLDPLPDPDAEESSE